MITFISCLAILIIGYFVYGTYVDKNAKLSDDNQTPAVRLEDGVDYMPMPWHKVFLIQFLSKKLNNISRVIQFLIKFNDKERTEHNERT